MLALVLVKVLWSTDAILRVERGETGVDSVTATLASFVPMDRRLALVHGEDLASRAAGSVLFLDISGYTRATEAFVTKHGTLQGADEMTHWLNGLYRLLIDCVHRYQGSVVGFSGDAMTCWFNEDAGVRAISAALEIRREVRRRAGRSPESEIVPLAVKMGLARGEVRRLTVGSADHRKLDLLLGDVLHEAALAESFAKPNDIILAPSLNDSVEGARGSKRGDGGRFLRLDEFAGSCEPNPWPRIAFEGVDPGLFKDWVHEAVYERLLDLEEEFQEELRRCVALFIKFKLSGDEHVPAFISLLQELVHKYGGVVIQLTIGDKGRYAYAAFGAPKSHEDDAWRAVSTACELLQEGRQQDYVSSLRIGIAQGLMRCGAYGGSRRMTYGVLGDAVNTAARLMSHAREGQLLLTQSVTRAAGGDLQFTECGPLELRGKSKATHLFSWVPGRKRFRRGTSGKVRASRISRHSTRKRRTKRYCLGRERELARIKSFLEEAGPGRGRILVVEGEAGMGKSILVQTAIENLNKSKGQVFFGGGDSIEVGTSYFAWRPVFSSLLEAGLDDRSLVERRQAIVARLPEGDKGRAPLLQSVLPLDWPENDLTRGLRGEVRADNTEQLLLGVLEHLFKNREPLFVFEAGHFIDSKSWSLIAAASREITGACFVLASRPVAEEVNEYTRLKNSGRTLFLTMGSLDKVAVQELVARSLNADDVEHSIVDYILEKAEGHPLFSEELVRALAESEVVTVLNRKAQLVNPSMDFATLNFPDTVQGIVTSRLDALPRDHLLTLKTASILGRNFETDLLLRIHPEKSSQQELAEHCDALERARFIVPVPGPAQRYSFVRAMTHVAVYNLMLSDQRCQLHKAVAEILEQDDKATKLSLLAYHWYEAIDSWSLNLEDVSRALVYLVRAGQRSLAHFANREAILFLQKSVELDDLADNPTESSERARWHGSLGLAFYGLGQVKEARHQLYEALRLLEFQLPHSRRTALTKFAAQLCRQLYRKTDTFAKDQVHPEAGNWMAAFHWYKVLGAIAILEQRALEAMHCAASMLRFAKKLRSISELRTAYGFTCLVASLVPMPSVAEAYNSRTLKILTQYPPKAKEDGVAYLLLGFYHSAKGEWDHSRQLLHKGCLHAANIGFRRYWEECYGVLNTVSGSVGPLRDCERGWRQVYQSAQRRSDFQARLWALTGLLESALKFGSDFHDPKHEGLLEDGLAALKNGAGVTFLRLLGLVAMALERCGRDAEAFDWVMRGMDVLKSAVPTVLLVFEGWTAIPIVAVKLWEKEGYTIPQSCSAEDFLEKLRACLPTLNLLGKLFPIAEPRVLLAKSMIAVCHEQQDMAREYRARGLGRARALTLPYDQALLLLEEVRQDNGPEAMRVMADALLAKFRGQENTTGE